MKENCPDTRNTKVIDIVNELKEYGINPIITDPVADADEAIHEYGIEFADINDVKGVDAIIFAVAHKEFINVDIEKVDSFFKDVPNGSKVIADVKGVLNRKDYEAAGYLYWCL